MNTCKKKVELTETSKGKEESGRVKINFTEYVIFELGLEIKRKAGLGVHIFMMKTFMQKYCGHKHTSFLFIS